MYSLVVSRSCLRACLHGVGDPGLVGLCFFCFHALGDTKQKKLTPLDRGPPLHVNRVLDTKDRSFTSFRNGLSRSYLLYCLTVSLYFPSSECSM